MAQVSNICQVYKQLCPGQERLRARYAALRTISHPAESQRVLDSNALVLHFSGPNSATGEDVLELHVHGGPAVVSSILGALNELSTQEYPVRYAEPGEFTRRAFYNDRLDLTQVEALGETLNAVTEEQRRLSVQGTRSKLGETYDQWRKMLLDARGELEALIDFSEDQHFDESAMDLADNVAAQVRALYTTIQYHLANAMRGELLRKGIVVSLIGKPNVGKSTILNRVVGRNAAIVSKEAGTTRDIIEVGVDLGGFFCRLGDTAGLRRALADDNGTSEAGELVNEVEQEGIRRAREQAENSDVVIVVFAATARRDTAGHDLDLEPEVVSTANALAQDGKKLVVVINKGDLLDAVHAEDGPARGTVLGTSTQVTREQDLKATVRKAIPAVPPSAIFLISCTQAQTGCTSDTPASPPFTPSALASSASSLKSHTADPGNFRAFIHGLVDVFREMTIALRPDDDSETRIEQSDITQLTPPGSSLWEDSLGATARQGQLLANCRDELNRFLDLVPGAKRPTDVGISTDMYLNTQATAPQPGVDPLASRTEGDTTRDTTPAHPPLLSLLDAAYGRYLLARGRQDTAQGPRAAGSAAIAIPDRPYPEPAPATPAKADAQAARASMAADLAPVAVAVPAARDDAAGARGSHPRPTCASTLDLDSVNADGTSSASGPAALDAEAGVGRSVRDYSGVGGCVRDYSEPRAGIREGRVSEGDEGFGSACRGGLDDEGLGGNDDACGAGGVRGFGAPGESARLQHGDGGGGREEDEVDIVAAAEHLRAAAVALGKITGRGDAGDVEEVLGVVFEK